MELAEKNAKLVLEKKERIARDEARTVGAVRQIAQLLDLPMLDRMEAFDISNISGFENVGSMVVYEKGKPKRSDYRKFRIKTVAGPDDYACMREVLTRRFEHGLKRDERAGRKKICPGSSEALQFFRTFADGWRTRAESTSRSRCWTSWHFKHSGLRHGKG